MPLQSATPGAEPRTPPPLPGYRTIVTSLRTSATYGLITSGGRCGFSGLRSSRCPSMRPLRATSTPVSSQRLANGGGGEIGVARLDAATRTRDVAAPWIALGVGALDHQQLRLAVHTSAQGEQHRGRRARRRAAEFRGPAARRANARGAAPAGAPPADPAPPMECSSPIAVHRRSRRRSGCASRPISRRCRRRLRPSRGIRRRAS